MTTYILLLRGINVGGKNKVAMPDLRLCLEKLGFERVRTYINSGNVLFDTETVPLESLISRCEEAILQTFGFRVVVGVIEANAFVQAMKQAPDWWGNDPESKHNAIFVIPPFTATQIAEEVGEALPDYEKVAIAEPIVFWSAAITTFSKTRWSKIVKRSAYANVTIRNANTAKKLLQLIKE